MSVIVFVTLDVKKESLEELKKYFIVFAVAMQKNILVKEACATVAILITT
ncbi:hypothetical protein [Nitrosopumilus sp.]